MAEMIFHPIDFIIGLVIAPITGVLGYLGGVVLEVTVDSSGATLPSNLSGFGSTFSLLFAIVGFMFGLTIGIYASMHYRGVTTTLAQIPKA
ncbi:MAG: hypothetical protein QXV17_11990 [Candidatus Micrarchaeaceae archaeon]